MANKRHWILIGDDCRESRVSQSQIDILLARNEITLAKDGTRRAYLKIVRRGRAVEWRKTRCYDPDTRVSIPTMQLVPVGTISKHRRV